MGDNNLLTLADYVDKLIAEKNYETVTDDIKLELKNELLRQLNDTLIARTIDKLSDSEISELNILLETKPSDEQLQDFIKSKIDDPQGFIAGVLLSFRKTYLGLEA
ncbi:MAG: hypothetical protein WCG44_04040 [bacterium]